MNFGTGQLAAGDMGPISVAGNGRTKWGVSPLRFAPVEMTALWQKGGVTYDVLGSEFGCG
jgi:hypothetical protein